MSTRDEKICWKNKCFFTTKKLMFVVSLFPILDFIILHIIWNLTIKFFKKVKHFKKI